MSISSLNSSVMASLQSSVNSNDALQQQIGTSLLKKSLQQEGQSALTLIASATSSATSTPSVTPGSLGYSVDIKV